MLIYPPTKFYFPYEIFLGILICWAFLDSIEICSVPKNDYLNLSSPLHFVNTAHDISHLSDRDRRRIRFQLCVVCEAGPVLGLGKIEFFVSNRRDLLDDSIIWHIDPTLLTSSVTKPDAVSLLSSGEEMEIKYIYYAHSLVPRFALCLCKSHLWSLFCHMMSLHLNSFLEGLCQTLQPKRIQLYLYWYWCKYSPKTICIYR